MQLLTQLQSLEASQSAPKGKLVSQAPPMFVYTPKLIS